MQSNKWLTEMNKKIEEIILIDREKLQQMFAGVSEIEQMAIRDLITGHMRLAVNEVSLSLQPWPLD